ncbi:MAG: hypothetical protein KAG99_11335 [Bacteroidales bacterium]|nr:hypothetical protein [Bacteroidales bacterium]
MKITLTIIAAFFILTVGAQDHRNAIGLRGGFSSGVTYRVFVDDFNAFEGWLGFRDNGMQATALFQHFLPVFLEQSDHFFLYWGVGGHVGYKKWERRYYYDPHYPQKYYYRKVASPVLGADAILGLEFRFYTIPIALSIDYKPFIELSGPYFFHANLHDFGFSVKYTF